MSQLYDCRFRALRDQGFVGSTNDMLLQWLQANGAVSNQVNDAWYEMLISQGFVAPFHRSDAWYALLGALGYTGSLQDRELPFWCSGGMLNVDNLYVNGEFAGAAEPNTPPDNHTYIFDQGAPTGVVLVGTFNRIFMNVDVLSTRKVYQYDLGSLNPDLEVGATYRISVFMQRYAGGGNAGATMLRLSNTSGITVVGSDVTVSESDGVKQLYIDFTVDDLVYSGLFEFGVGLTTQNTANISVERARLVKTSDDVPLNALTTDSGIPLTDDSGDYITEG